MFRRTPKTPKTALVKALADASGPLVKADDLDNTDRKLRERSLRTLHKKKDNVKKYIAAHYARETDRFKVKGALPTSLTVAEQMLLKAHLNYFHHNMKDMDRLEHDFQLHNAPAVSRVMTRATRAMYMTELDRMQRKELIRAGKKRKWSVWRTTLHPLEQDFNPKYRTAKMFALAVLEAVDTKKKNITEGNTLIRRLREVREPQAWRILVKDVGDFLKS